MWKIIVNDGETRWGPDWTWIDVDARHGLNKLASTGVHVPPPLAQKIAELKTSMPRDKVAFYNRALGAFESFGLNRNGDGFARGELRHKHDTFVKNAHYFAHHVNRDPALARGRPVASAFNDKTDMVDLVIVADADKCGEQIQALESGRRVPTSMGAKVAFDVCTICSAKSRTRDEYCGHVHKLAQAPYGMRSVLADGRVCGVMNPDPNFFDISDVVIGAAPESETLLKVASAAGAIGGAELAEILGLAKSARDVEAAIVKKIPGTLDGNPVFRRGICELSRRETPIPDQILDRVVKTSGFDGLLRNSAALGIVLGPREFAHAAKLGAFTAPTLSRVWATESMPQKILTASLDPQSLALLAPYHDQRSAAMPALFNRLPVLCEKTAAPLTEGGDLRAQTAYAAYRHALLDADGDVGGRDGDFWRLKCAGTRESMFGDRSRDYLASAYLRPESNLLDPGIKIAQPLSILSANMADELGTKTLDLLTLSSMGERNE